MIILKHGDFYFTGTDCNGGSHTTLESSSVATIRKGNMYARLWEVP